MNGLEVRKIREKMNLTQKELAVLTGNSERTIINYENGKVIPKTKHEIFQNLLNKNIKNTLNLNNEIIKPQEITNQNNDLEEMTEIELLKKTAILLFGQLEEKELKIIQLQNEIKECKEEKEYLTKDSTSSTMRKFNS